MAGNDDDDDAVSSAFLLTLSGEMTRMRSGWSRCCTR